MFAVAPPMRTIFILIVLIFAVPAAVLIALMMMVSLGTERSIFERARSPDGEHEARVQFDDAGAVSSFSRLVFVKSRWNPSDSAIWSCRAFWGEGEEAVHLRWIGDQTLMIEHAFPASQVRAVETNCGPVKITTQPLP